MYFSKYSFQTMGLFSSVIHVFDKAQFDVVTAVSAELKERLGNCQFSKIELDATNVWKDVIYC